MYVQYKRLEAIYHILGDLGGHSHCRLHFFGCTDSVNNNLSWNVMILL
jgi:hypothetical protein